MTSTEVLSKQKLTNFPANHNIISKITIAYTLTNPLTTITLENILFTLAFDSKMIVWLPRHVQKLPTIHHVWLKYATEMTKIRNGHFGATE
jgi:BarA-like signal transduction histidine kinase